MRTFKVRASAIVLFFPPPPKAVVEEEEEEVRVLIPHCQSTPLQVKVSYVKICQFIRINIKCSMLETYSLFYLLFIQN